MNQLSFLGRIIYSLKLLVNSPLIPLSSLLLYILIIIFSKFSSSIKEQLTTTLTILLWLAIFTLFAVGTGSFIFSGMMGLAKNAIKNKASANINLKIFFLSAKNYWLRNSQIITLIIAIGASITYISLQIAKFSLIFLNAKASLVLLFLLQLSGVLGIISFLALASFILIYDNGSALQSIKKSIFLVKKHYLLVSWPLLLFFIISGIISILVEYKILSSLITELIQALLIFPLFVIFFLKLTAELEEK